MKRTDGPTKRRAESRITPLREDSIFRSRFLYSYRNIIPTRAQTDNSVYKLPADPRWCRGLTAWRGTVDDIIDIGGDVLASLVELMVICAVLVVVVVGMDRVATAAKVVVVVGGGPR